MKWKLEQMASIFLSLLLFGFHSYFERWQTLTIKAAKCNIRAMEKLSERNTAAGISCYSVQVL